MLYAFALSISTPLPAFKLSLNQNLHFFSPPSFLPQMWTLCDSVSICNLPECEELLSILDPTSKETDMFADEGCMLSIAVQSEDMGIVRLLTDHWVRYHLLAARAKGPEALEELRSIASDVIFNEMLDREGEMARFLNAMVAEHLQPDDSTVAENPQPSNSSPWANSNQKPPQTARSSTLSSESEEDTQGQARAPHGERHLVCC